MIATSSPSKQPARLNSLAKNFNNLPKNYNLSEQSATILQDVCENFAMQFLHEVFRRKEWRQKNLSIRQEDMWNTLHSVHEFDFVAKRLNNSVPISQNSTDSNAHRTDASGMNPLFYESQQSDENSMNPHFLEEI